MNINAYENVNTTEYINLQNRAIINDCFDDLRQDGEGYVFNKRQLNAVTSKLKVNYNVTEDCGIFTINVNKFAMRQSEIQ